MNFAQDHFEINIDKLDGPDYVDYEYWDETSIFDDHPTRRWAHGTECYERRYKCRVPKDIKEELIDDWICDNIGRITWLD